MDVVSVSTRSYLDGLPEPLRVAQEAVNLPEVQEMARKLATYNLGVFMPHTHNERTGAFDEMPSGIIQVEEGLAVSFRSAVEIENDQARHVPVGWVWRDDGLTAALNCVQTCVQQGRCTRTATSANSSLFETSEPAPTLAGSLENGGVRGTTRLSEGLSYNQRAVLAAIVTREILTAGAGSLLDIGAGPPEAAVPLAAQVETYLAVERDPRHALHLRQAGLSVVEATFPVSLGRSFDLVVSSHSIPEEDVSLYDAFVDAAWEAVRPGGVLLIITFKGPHGGLGALRTEVTGRKHGYAEYAALMTLLQGRGPIEEELVPSHAKSTDVADLTAFFAGWLFQSDAEARTGRRKLQDVLKRGYCRDGVYAVPTNHNVIRCRKLAQPRAVGEKVDALLAEEAR